VSGAYDVLTGAIVGFGEVARHGHWPGYASSREVRIAAVVDRTAERREEAQRLDPGIAAFASLTELLDSGLPLDFIDICTPPALHAAPMLAALDRGWHVLCEKPFLIDAAPLAMVRTRIAGGGLAAIPVHNWKYAPIVQAATDALRSGAIGRLRQVRIETSRTRAAATADVNGPNWRRDPAVAGGGILMDHGWHAVYLACHWFGVPHASVRCTLHRPASGEVEDEASVTIGFPGGEARIALTWNGSSRRNAMSLAGDAGEIEIDDSLLRVRGPRPATRRFPQPLSAGSHHAEWFAAMLPDIVATLRAPALGRPLFDEAAECLEIIQSAYLCDAALASPPR
jgi:predicted dehydrogenase